MIMTKGATTTLWNFLNQTAICIPIIQRDYAQGGSRKEELRKRFLGALHDALQKQETLKLDFVYGTFSKGTFYPLDGQQRLTTLWLLHWYIAYKAGKLNEAEATLQKFSYATRVSARDFCNKLCTLTQLPEGGSDILKHITNQNWFYAAWLQDPTIQSMLRMISDAKHKTGIVELIKLENYADAWTWLTGSDCKVVFQVLDIAILGQTDDLYVKMNARGKPLTSFENFKAELVNYIHRQAEDKKKTKQEHEQWQALDSPYDGFGQKLDNAWTDIFWKMRSRDSSGIMERQSHIDEIFFAFFNRFFFNEQAIHARDDWNKLPLYGNNGADARLDFANLKRYKDDKDEISLERFQKMEKILDRLPALCGYSEFNAAIAAPWKQDDKGLFLPEYAKDTIGNLVPIADDGQNEILQITRITVKQRAVFFAIGKWLVRNSPKYDEEQKTYSSEQLDAFKDWMRVVWNIVENSDADSNLPEALKLIDELAKHSGDILAFLASDETVTSEFAKEQLKEERLKAKLMASNNDWHEKFKEAEALPIFKGRLSVILEASNQYVGMFDTIVSKCKEYISSDMQKMSEAAIGFFQSYLTYAQDCDLPLKFDSDFFNPGKWKDMFFTDTKKKGVISWLKSFFSYQEHSNTTGNWASNLLEHWNELTPWGINEYKRIAAYGRSWGNNKVFLCRTKNIAGAQLISDSLRACLTEGLTGTAQWYCYGYCCQIKLDNGLTVFHHPDDFTVVNKDNKTINSLSLNEDNIDCFIQECKRYVQQSQQ